jgi:PAS domain S-box-containing protein
MLIKEMINNSCYMKTKLYALVLEDIRKDAELLNEILSGEGFDMEMDVVETETDFVLNLKRHNYDIIFADFTLPSFNGQAALELAKNICPNIPFICISGTIGEDRAVELLKQGATDYVLKDRMERLAMATRRALEATIQLNKFRQTEIELQTNRRLLQTIINNALDTIYIKDLNGKYLLVNEAAEKAIGKTAHEIVGKDDNFFFSPTEAQRIIDIDKKVIETTLPITYEESLTLIDGNIHIFHTIKCPMFDDYGKPNGLFGIARDITERKLMEQHLTEAKEKAEESDRLKTAFLQNISHEIRTPMNAIIGFANFLNEPNLAPDKRQHFTEIITQSSEHLLCIISDILSIATIESGQERIVKKEFDLNTIFRNLQEQFSLIAENKNISLNLVPFSPGNEMRIISDEIKLIQILTNLISNAIKFTQQGHVNWGYTKKENYLEFFIEDTGIGIPHEMYDEIFKRFRQVESTMTRQFGGSGLGLSISKAYIELLGGKIWLNSEIGKGSVFYFTIPYLI